MRTLKAFFGDTRGNIAMLMAAGMAVSAVISAFAVDAAALYQERRLLQSATDLAAIAAARNPANALEIAYDSLREAGVFADSVSLELLADPTHSSQLTVTPGWYEPDPMLSVAQRFSPGTGRVNAVRVAVKKPGRLYFAASWSPLPTLGTTAIASVTPRVAFSVGSRLARLEGGIANALLNRLLGTSIDLSLVDYNGIANAEVSVLSFLDALAIEMGVSAGTYRDVLGASATRGQVAHALAASLDGAEAAAARTIAAALTGDAEFPLGDLLDLGDLAGLAIGSGGNDLFAGVGALDMLAATAALGDGVNQASLSLNAGVPGLAGIDVDLAIGEPPQQAAWFAIGPTETVARTAQVRLKLDARLLGGSGLLGAGVNLPLYAEIAHAEAMVETASCPSPTAPNGSATLLARPGIARLAVGSVSDASFRQFGARPSIGMARLVDVLLLKIRGSALIDIAATTPASVAFSSGEIANGTIKTVGTTTPVASLTASLFEELELDISILGLGLGSTKAITASLNALLAPIAPVLDRVITGLLETLGLSLGEADLRVYGVTCTHPVLVN